MTAQTKTYPSPQDLLPHKDSALKISQIIDYQNDNIFCLVNVTAFDGDLLTCGNISSAIGIEYIAQAGGLLGALKNETVKPGMVVSVKKLLANVSYFKVNEKLIVKVALVAETPSSFKFTGEVCTINDPETVLFSAEILVVLLA